MRTLANKITNYHILFLPPYNNNFFNVNIKALKNCKFSHIWNKMSYLPRFHFSPVVVTQLQGFPTGMRPHHSPSSLVFTCSLCFPYKAGRTIIEHGLILKHDIRKAKQEIQTQGSSEVRLINRIWCTKCFKLLHAICM